MLDMQWIFTCLLAFVGIWVMGLNYSCVYLWVARREHHSLIPLIGGIASGVAMLICPIRDVHGWAWLPILVDLGCAYTLASFVYAVLVLKASR